MCTHLGQREFRLRDGPQRESAEVSSPAPPGEQGLQVNLVNTIPKETLMLREPAIPKHLGGVHLQTHLVTAKQTAARSARDDAQM